MAYYPVNLLVDGRKCLVLGGGDVAERKTLGLINAGASVTVCSPDITEGLAQLAAEAKIEYIKKRYYPEMIDDYFIVVCATNDSEVNRAAAEKASAQGALVNTVDGLSGNFTVPASVVRGDLVITVSTNGKSPMLARRLREDLAERYGAEYGQYLELVACLRSEVKMRPGEQEDRQLLWRDALDEEVIALLRLGKITEAEEKLRIATCERAR